MATAGSPWGYAVPDIWPSRPSLTTWDQAETYQKLLSRSHCLYRTSAVEPHAREAVVGRSARLDLWHGYWTKRARVDPKSHHYGPMGHGWTLGSEGMAPSTWSLGPLVDLCSIMTCLSQLHEVSCAASINQASCYSHLHSYQLLVKQLQASIGQKTQARLTPWCLNFQE